MQCRATLLCGWERAGVESSSPEVEKVHGQVVAVGLSSGRPRGNRGVEDGAALRDFGGVPLHEPVHVFRWHPGVAP